jgi:FkbM family methyltransferase
MVKYKSLLLKFPMLYESVQSIRDSRFHRRHSRLGTFAQHKEDIELMRLLAQAEARGPYVDVGCNHPFKLSNTYLLYLNGWRGICVDPLPRFERLFRRWRPQDRFECAAVGEHPGELTLFEFESDVLSTLESTLAAAYERQGNRLRRRTPVQIRPIDAILEQHRVQAPVSLLSIDIEGQELTALKSMKIEKWRPSFVCMEVLTADGHRNEPAIEFLTNQGYRPVLDLGLNIVYRRDAG